LNKISPPPTHKKTFFLGGEIFLGYFHQFMVLEPKTKLVRVWS
jgi:hypothetical protein